jgi:NADPH-dependent ferric siderophore reductase
MTQTQHSIARSTQRVRHETRLRRLKVVAKTDLSPGMVRITLAGTDLAGFTSLAADDHVKVFFPAAPGGVPILPPRPPGTPLPEGAAQPISRDYTPRRFDPQRNELDIEFALHGAGPAAEWAAAAQPGHELAIGGPRGSFVVSGEFDWYWLIGDEAALPAIARRLQELPAQAAVSVVVEVARVGEEVALPPHPRCAIHWLHRDGMAAGSPDLVARAVAALNIPPGTGYVWVACESNVARHLRSQLLARGLDKQWLKASGYWKLGAINTHERIDD